MIGLNMAFDSKIRPSSQHELCRAKFRISSKNGDFYKKKSCQGLLFELNTEGLVLISIIKMKITFGNVRLKIVSNPANFGFAKISHVLAKFFTFFGWEFGGILSPTPSLSQKCKFWNALRDFIHSSNGESFVYFSGVNFQVAQTFPRHLNEKIQKNRRAAFLAPPH